VLALLPAPMGKSLLRSSALRRVGQHCGKLALDAFELRCDPPAGRSVALPEPCTGESHDALGIYATRGHSEFDNRRTDSGTAPPWKSLMARFVPHCPQCRRCCVVASNLPGDDFMLKLRPTVCFASRTTLSPNVASSAGRQDASSAQAARW